MPGSPAEIDSGFGQADGLDGAKNGRVTNLQVLETIAGNTNLTIDFGGGIKSDEDIKSVFDAGAGLASIGSVAVKARERFFAWLDRFGDENLAATIRAQRSRRSA